MSAYLSQFSFTEQGVRAAKDNAQIVPKIRQAAEAAGGRVIGCWWTFGQYDGFLVLEMPDDETAARFLIQSAMQGNARSVTTRCFSEEEVARIVKGLP